MPTYLPPNSVRLYHRGTPNGHDLYPVSVNERVSRVQTGAFERRVVTGPVSADAEQLISSWTQDDYSGGFGIKDANESTDTSRIAFGVIDGRRPKSMCLPPLTETVTGPTWAETGAFWPLGDIGSQFYGAWGNGISGWNTTTDAWYTVQNAWPASFVPLNEAVTFCGGLFVPGGAQGFVRLSELTAATGTLTVASLGTITARAFALHDGKLWAIDTANKLWMLTARGAAAGATTLSSWNSASVPGVPVGTGNADGPLILDTSLTPTELVNYFNAAQEETLWCITRGQGAYLFEPGQPAWIKSTIRAGAHPDWGNCAEVFRDGEDLFIAGGGLDLTRFTTANVEVPLSGPSKDQGVPPGYQGTITDLVSERSSMYALVQAGTGVTEGVPVLTFILQNTFGNLGAGTSPVQFNTPAQVAVDSSGNAWIADTGNNRVQKLTSAGVYSTGIAGVTGVTGVAVDSSGNVYVGYTGFVAKYNSSLVLQWSMAVSNPVELATDGTSLFVTRTNHVVEKRLCSDGSLAYTVGDTSSSTAFVVQATYGPTFNGIALSSPGQLAKDSSDNIYIADTGNGRIVKIDGNGAYVSSITGLGAAKGVCVDASGNIFISFTAGGVSSVIMYNSAGVFVRNLAAVASGDTVGHITTDSTHVYGVVTGASNFVRKWLISSGAGVALWGTTGSGNDNYTTPYGIAVTGGEVYVVDAGNSRVKVTNTTGTYIRQWAISANARGTAFDASGDVLVAEYGSDLVKRYDNTGTPIDSFAQTDPDGLAVTTGDVVWVSNATDGNVVKWDEVTTISGAASSANGEFDTPKGIALDSTHAYVVDQGNSRVQKLLKADGTYVTKWGTPGATDGLFSTPNGITLDDSGDVWVADTGNNRAQRFSNTGTFQTKIVQSSPRGVGRATGDILWISTGQHNLAKWDEETVIVQQAVAALTWLGAWTGTAWCALWESATAMVPTWMRVSMTGDYALWWGNEAGVAYRQLLPPPFFNPAARMTLGVYPFAPTGWMESVRYDANMSGWDQIASHFFAMMDFAAPDIYVDVSYRTDADQWDSGDFDPPYRPWKRIDHIGRSLCWFDDVDIEPMSGLPWQEGEPFQWIQFRYDFVRGSDTFASPLWMWHSLHHLSVPQDNASFTFKIPLSFERGVYNRSPNEMAETLRGLQKARVMLHLQTSNPRPGNPEQQVFFRGRITKVNSEFYPGADNNIDEIIVVNFIEVGASSNLHTTLATATPA